MKNISILFSMCFAFLAWGQVGIGTQTPNSDALLDLNSSTKGLILPRVALNSLTSFAPLSVHVAGMVVYNTSNTNNVSPGLYYNSGTAWIRMTTDAPRIGEIKNGFQAADHNGWYLLDGRAVTTLPAGEVRNNATALGYVNLPNATDRFFKTLTGAETIGSVAGAASIVLTQANLPNITFTGSTNLTGAHTHTYTDNLPTAVLVGNTGGGTNPITGSGDTVLNNFNAGLHNHTVTIPSGGTATPVSYTPSYIVTNVFIYLGN